MSDDQTFEVDQIAENLSNGDGLHQVQVQLSPMAFRELLTDFVRGIFRARAGRLPIFSAIMDAGRRDSRGLEHIAAVTRVKVLLGQEQPSWLLSPEEATALAQQLLEAAEEPSSCWCGRYIESPSGLTVNSGCSMHAAKVYGDGSD